MFFFSSISVKTFLRKVTGFIGDVIILGDIGFLSFVPKTPILCGVFDLLLFLLFLYVLLRVIYVYNIYFLLFYFLLSSFLISVAAVELAFKNTRAEIFTTNVCFGRLLTTENTAYFPLFYFLLPSF